jgi:hypothetical protein
LRRSRHDRIHNEGWSTTTLPATTDRAVDGRVDHEEPRGHIGNGFSNGFDPHAVTAYAAVTSTLFPAGDALAVLADWGTSGSSSGTPPGRLAVVDLTRMLRATFVPRTSGAGLGDACLGPLPSTVLAFVSQK